MEENEPEVDLYCPASPVEVQTAQMVSPETVVATGTCLLPDGGSYEITATNQTGRAGEEEHHTGIRGMREEGRRGGEQMDTDLVHAVEMTYLRNCTAKRPGGRRAIPHRGVTKDPGAQMKRKAGGEKEVKGRIGLRSRPVTSL